jgi:hypothetical protein
MQEESAMISIYNGRSRVLGGGSKDDIYLQVSVALRKHLHLFKGARLALFMAVALHSDKDGWSRPSMRLLSTETGYNPQTLSLAVRELSKLMIDGHRVLLVVQGNDGRFEVNRYLVFPTAEDIAIWEPHTENLDTEKRGTDDSYTEDLPGPHTENLDTAQPYTEPPSSEHMIERRTSSKENHEEVSPTQAYLLSVGANPTSARELAHYDVDAVRHHVTICLNQYDQAQWGRHMGLVVPGLRTLGPERVKQNYERYQQERDPFWSLRQRGA